MKKNHWLISLLLLSLSSFFIGSWYNSCHIGTYAVHGFRVSFHRDWPTYGLPLADYAELLALLRNRQSDQAAERLEVLLDEAIYDAERRRALLRGQDLPSLDKSLSRAANYRKQFPRRLTDSTNSFWTAQKQKEVDNFLGSFAGVFGTGTDPKQPAKQD